MSRFPVLSLYMADFTWNFDVRVLGANDFTKFHKASQSVEVTINLLTRATQNAGNTASSSWQKFVKGAGVFNTLNKAIRFAIADLKLFGQLWQATAGKFLTDIGKEGGGFQIQKESLRARLGSGAQADADTERLAAFAREQAKKPSVNLNEAMAGTEDLLKAGNSVDEIMQRLTPSLRLAKAEQIGVAQAASVVTTAWNGFEKELRASGKTFEDTANLLSATASASPIKQVTQLQAALTNGGKEAQNFGLSFQDTLTVLGQFAKMNITAGRAGTVLRGIFGRMSKDTPAVNKAFQQLNVSIADSTGKIKPYKQILAELQAAFANIDSEVERMRLYDALGGRFKAQLQGLVEAGVAGFDAMSEAIEHNNGVLQRLEGNLSKTYDASKKTFQSAVSSMRVSAFELLKIPMTEWWNTWAKVINIVGDRITAVTERFKTAGKDLDAWIDILNTEGLSGLFAGLGEEVKGEIDRVKDIVKAGVKVIGELLKEVWTIFLADTGIVGQIRDFAVDIGLEIGKGIIVGIGKGIAGGLEKNKQETKARLDSYQGAEGAVGVMSMLSPTESVLPEVELPVEVKPEIKPPEKSDIEKAIASYRQDMEDAVKGGGGESGGAGASSGWVLEWTSKSDEALKAYAERSKASMQKFRESLADTEQDARKRGIAATVAAAKPQETDYSFMSTEELEAQKQQLTAQKALNDAKREQHELSGKIVQEEVNLKLTLAEQATALKKYLLEPVDQFLQKLREIKNQFSKVFSSLRGQKLDISEKFGLMSTEKATRQRQTTLRYDIRAAQEQVRLAQTASEKQAAYEQLGQLQGKYAETSTGREQTSAAQKGASYFDKALKAARDAQAIELQKVKFDQDYAFTAIREREQARGTFGTAQQELANLQQLQSAYQQTGNVLGLQSLKAQIDNLTIKASGEQTTVLKDMREILKVGFEQLRRGNEQIYKQNEDAAQQRKAQIRTMQEMPVGGIDPALASP